MIASGALYFVVERAKKCLDHSITLYILHCLLCTYFRGFPMTWEWWAVTLMSTGVMSLLGGYLCLRREMADIPIIIKGDKGDTDGDENV